MAGVGEDGEGKVPRFGRRRWNSGANFDLRELEAAIRDAYVSKELAAQVAEAEAARIGERARDRYACEMSRMVVEEEKKRAEERRREERSGRMMYGRELLDAVAEKETRERLAREQAAREREIVEEVSRVMEAAEESDKSMRKRKLADRMIREGQIFEEIKVIRRKIEADIREAERSRESEYLKEREARIANLKKAKALREAARAAVIETVARGLLDARCEKLEKEAILRDLVAEELWLREETKLREEEDRRRSARREAAIEMERHLLVVEEQKLRHRIEEEEFAALVMRRVLEDAKTDRLTLEAKKRKQIEYRQQLEAIIEERRTRRAEELIRLKECLELERARDIEVADEAREMRERLVKTHAENVSRFIKSAALTKAEYALVAKYLVDPQRRNDEAITE